MKDRTHQVVRTGALAAAAAFGLGVAVMIAGVAFYGDWWLIRRPWVDFGLGLLIVGLAAGGIFAVLWIATEPLGWWRFAAGPGLAVTGLLWFSMAIVGLPLTGACCNRPTPDVGVALYSLPVLIPIWAASTASILLPIPLARLFRMVRAA